MPRRQQTQYEKVEAQQPYMGDYSALAQQFLKKRDKPIYSVGQGLVEAGSDIAEAFLMKNAAEREKRKEDKDISDVAMAQRFASNPNLTRVGVNDALGQERTIANSVFDRPAEPTERYAGAMAQMQDNPRAQLAAGPGVMELAKQFEPKPPVERFTDEPLPNGGIGQRSSITNELKVPFNPPAPRESEPLVEVADPNDPTRGIMVPRSQAAGRATVQTVRDRMPRVKTYWSEDGGYQQLDSNSEEDQKIIRELGLTDKAPTDSERTAKGFLDRMEAAERKLDTILEGKPEVMAGMYDAVVNKIPLIGNKMVSDDYQTAMQKIKDWTRAKLRKESGAVIGDQEALDEFKTYFAIPGDNENTVAGKKSSRAEARKQLATSAGILGRPSLRAMESAPSVKVPAVGTVEGGYRFKGGNPADKNNWAPVDG